MEDADPMTGSLQDVDETMTDAPLAGASADAKAATAGGPGATGDTPVGTSVYVGNLSWDTRWQSLKDHMRRAGDVAHAEVFTEASGRSAGCGVVEYASVDAAKNAIATLNETFLDGRQIFVRVDRERGKSRHPRSSHAAASGGHADAQPVRFYSGGGGGGGSGGGEYHRGAGYGQARNSGGIHVHNGHGDHYGGRAARPSDRGRKIVVWNLPYHIRWQDLKDLFRDFGPVIRADVQQTHDGKSKGMGTVLFESEADAQRAIDEMTGKEIDGRVIDCRLDRFAQ